MTTENDAYERLAEKIGAPGYPSYIKLLENQLTPEEAEFLVGAGGKAYYGNGNQWGFQLAIETAIPLTEEVKFSLSPRIAFVSDEVVTEWEGKISWRVIDYLSLALGYRSLSLPAEDLTIEGLHIGLALVF